MRLQPIEQLIARLSTIFSLTPPASDVENSFKHFASSKGFELPSDLQELYRHCGSATCSSTGYTLVALNEIEQVSIGMLGDETEDYCPKAWCGFFDLCDSDWAALNLASVNGSQCEILDCHHEDVWSCKIIAQSVSEFLTRLLDANGEPYWLEPEFQGYGFLDYEAPPSFYQRIDAGWCEKLGPEIGPQICTAAGCTRKQIAYSTKCLRHHYQMTEKRPWPFDDPRTVGVVRKLPFLFPDTTESLTQDLRRLDLVQKYRTNSSPSLSEWNVARFAEGTVILNIRTWRVRNGRFEIALFLAEDHHDFIVGGSAMAGLVMSLQAACRYTNSYAIFFVGPPEGDEPRIPESIVSVAGTFNMNLQGRSSIEHAEGLDLFNRLVGLSQLRADPRHADTFYWHVPRENDENKRCYSKNGLAVLTKKGQ